MRQVRIIALTVLAACGVAQVSALVPERRPSLFHAFYWGNQEFLADARVFSAPEVRAAVEKRLKARSTYRPRLPPFATPGSIDDKAEMHHARRSLEGFIVALAGRSGVEAEASAYAKQAVLWYGWEGFADGPIAEADVASKYVGAHPRTAIRVPLEIFMLHRYRSAFESATINANLAERDSGSKDPVKVAEFRKYSTSLQLRAADAYVAHWSRLQSATDLVARAVAEDIDAQAFVYQRAELHPRTFRR